MSSGHQTTTMSERELREHLVFLAQLKEDGLLHTEAVMYACTHPHTRFCPVTQAAAIASQHGCAELSRRLYLLACCHSAQQRALLKKYHSTLLSPSPSRGGFGSELAADELQSYLEGGPAQHHSSAGKGSADLEAGVEPVAAASSHHRNRQTTMEMLGLTFGKHAKRGITSWFIIAGVLHFALDGIFVIFGNSENMISGWMAPWRVYAQEDERYSRRSSLINAVQVLGAFVHGPLCFVAGWGIHRERNWYPIVAVLVSFCELYNRVILISTFDSLSTKLGNPSPQFLFAFVAWNLLWIVIPAGALEIPLYFACPTSPLSYIDMRHAVVCLRAAQYCSSSWSKPSW